jgi:hypothetical protein
MSDVEYARVVDALDGALARWEEIVIGDVGDETYAETGLTSETCSLVDASLLNGAFIEDVAVLMSIAPFDGPEARCPVAVPAATAGLLAGSIAQREWDA